MHVWYRVLQSISLIHSKGIHVCWTYPQVTWGHEANTIQKWNNPHSPHLYHKFKPPYCLGAPHVHKINHHQTKHMPWASFHTMSGKTVHLRTLDCNLYGYEVNTYHVLSEWGWISSSTNYIEFSVFKSAAIKTSWRTTTGEVTCHGWHPVAMRLGHGSTGAAKGISKLTFFVSKQLMRSGLALENPTHQAAWGYLIGCFYKQTSPRRSGLGPRNCRKPSPICPANTQNGEWWGTITSITIIDKNLTMYELV